MKRKNCRRIISELEQKTSEDASGSVVLDQLGDAIRIKEAIERKLLTSYSLGRDKSPKSRSLLPLYNGKTKSYSFHSGNTENVTIFNTISDSTTEEDIERRESEVSFDSSRSSSSSNSSGNSKIEEYQSNVLEDTRSALKGKAPMEDADSFDTKWEDEWSVAGNPLYSDPQFEESNLESDKPGKVSYVQEKNNQKTSFFKRRTMFLGRCSSL